MRSPRTGYFAVHRRVQGPWLTPHARRSSPRSTPAPPTATAAARTPFASDPRRRHGLRSTPLPHTAALGAAVEIDRSVRLARGVERLDGDVRRGDAGRARRLRRVEDAWLRGLSPVIVQRVSLELRFQPARAREADTA